MEIYTGEDAHYIYDVSVFEEIWDEYNPDNPEETIEIVPTKKWFVRSKEKDDEGYWDWLVKYHDDELSPEYNSDDNIPRQAVEFDKKEGAEIWTNPLTEAVLLPVEED